MDILITLVVGGLFALICYSMAVTRNRNAVGWAVFGFLCGAIPVILLACLGDLKKELSVEEIETMLTEEK